MIGADALIGFILHIIISAVIGALYTGLFMQYVDLGSPLYNIAVGGLIYGVIWWIIGGLIIMPAIAGGDLLQIDLNSPSLFGHVMFGHALAFLVAFATPRMTAWGRRIRSTWLNALKANTLNGSAIVIADPFCFRRQARSLLAL